MADDLAAELKHQARLIEQQGSVLAWEEPDDLQVVERIVVRQWSESALAEFGLEVTNIRSNSVAKAPPDCYADCAGREISIELTELVNGDLRDAIREERKRGIDVNPHLGAYFHQGQYDQKSFEAELNQRLEAKQKKYTKNGHRFDVLLIYSTENWLLPYDVMNWLNTIHLNPRTCFRTAYLILNYQPGHSPHWPVFKLYGDL